MPTQRTSSLYLVILVLALCFSLNTGCQCVMILPPAELAKTTPKENQKNLPKTEVPKENPKIEQGVCLQLESKLQDFGAMPFQCKSASTKEVIIHHKNFSNCPKSVQITGIELLEKSNSGFRVHDPGQFPISLKAGESLTIKVSFQASNELLEKNNLQVSTDLIEQPQLYVALQGKGLKQVAERLETFKQVHSSADILLVLDNSRSMQSVQTNLAKNFASFIQWAKKLNTDYHMGIAPMQIEEDKKGCLYGSPKVLTPKTPDLEKAFARNTAPPRTVRSPEAGLEVAYRALNFAKKGKSGCNAGFLRDEALLSIVFFSDEPDQSTRSYDFYLKFFKGFKGKSRTHMVRASAIVGPMPNGCNTGFGIPSKPGPKYINISKALSGVHASICDQNWDKTLRQVGLASILTRLRFKLRQQADIKSLKVTINGKTIPESTEDGWEYDPKTNEVIFHGVHVPKPGSQINVRYTVACPEP